MFLGLYNLSSAGKPLGQNLHYTHAIHLVVGIGVAMMVASVPYRHLEGLAYPILFLVLILLSSTAVFGKIVNGSRRWLSLGPMTLQTSDLAKVAIIVIVARTLHMERWEDGGLLLRDVFRPMNVSRPVILLAAVLALSLFGEQVRPPKIERWSRTRYRSALTLRKGIAKVILGRRPNKKEGERSVSVSHRGVKKRHVMIQRDNNGWFVAPQDGADTLLNEQVLEERTRLKHGDVVQLGQMSDARVRFSFSLQRTRGLLPWLALIGVFWLFVTLRLQLSQGTWHFRDVIAPIDVVLLPCVLILGQPDLGTTLVILLIAFSMILYVGLQPRSLMTLITGGIVFGAVAWWFILEEYQRRRVLSWLKPQNDLAGEGYHQNQSLIAVGSGEVLGKGHGQGTQTQLSFLPEQQTDFIFSVWAEEHGFVGSALVVILFTGLLLASLRIAQRARDRFGALLVVGVTSMLFWHTIVNMLMVLRLAPVVGVPLPLWSNGGSFVLTTMLGVGLVINVSARRTMF